ncbi:MAG TPA: hypothetical protein VIJ50_07900 [Solirubrobacteraceae bacterium]
MRKIKILGLAIVAVCVLGSIAVASASAAPEWLVGGAKMESSLLVESEGNLLLEDMTLGVDVTCSGKFIGTVGPGAKDLITEVLDLENKNPLSCKASICEGELVAVTPVNLPWETELLLITVGGKEIMVDMLLGSPGYSISCKTILGTTKDVCTGATASEEINVTGGVEGVFSENEEITAPGTCEVGGAKSGLVVGSGVSKPDSGTLTVSE